MVRQSVTFQESQKTKSISIVRSNYRPQSRGDVYYEEINSNVKALYLKYKDIYSPQSEHELGSPLVNTCNLVSEMQTCWKKESSA